MRRIGMVASQAAEPRSRAARWGVVIVSVSLLLLGGSGTARAHEASLPQHWASVVGQSCIRFPSHSTLLSTAYTEAYPEAGLGYVGDVGYSDGGRNSDQAIYYRIAAMNSTTRQTYYTDQWLYSVNGWPWEYAYVDGRWWPIGSGQNEKVSHISVRVPRGQPYFAWGQFYYDAVRNSSDQVIRPATWSTWHFMGHYGC